MRYGFLASGPDEQRLLERTKSGDRKAFEALISTHAGAIYSYISFRCKNPADAADITQNTMLSIWQSIAGFHHQSSFKTWCLSIARRRLADFYRKHGREETFPLADYENILSDSGSINEANVRMDIEQAMASLNDRDSELVYLIFRGQLTYPEISEMLGIPVGTIKSRMSAIKSRLKELLGEEE